MLFRRLERFRPTKHKHWGCTCLLYSSKHSAQQFSTILAYHTRIILARCITLHVKQAPNLTENVLKISVATQSCVLSIRITHTLIVAVIGLLYNNNNNKKEDNCHKDYILHGEESFTKTGHLINWSKALQFSETTAISLYSQLVYSSTHPQIIHF